MQQSSDEVGGEESIVQPLIAGHPQDTTAGFRVDASTVHVKRAAVRQPFATVRK
jgi:hypothetical protein